MDDERGYANALSSTIGIANTRESYRRTRNTEANLPNKSQLSWPPFGQASVIPQKSSLFLFLEGILGGVSIERLHPSFR